jgi:streptogramin lyase
MRIVTSLKRIFVVIAAISVAAVVAGMAVYYYSQPSSPANISEQEQEAEKKQSTSISSTDLVVSESRNTSSSIVTPNPYVREFQLPKDNFPNGILVDSNGTVWTVGAKSNSLIAFDPDQNKARSYLIPSGDSSGFGMVWTMAEDIDDGYIIFSGFGEIPLWRFDPQTESFESIDSLSVAPIQMKFDQDNERIWYASLHAGVIGVVVAVQKEGQEYVVAKELELGEESFPSGVYLQNKTLWITQSADGKIISFNITTTSEGETVVDIAKMAEFPQQEMLFSPSDIIINGDSAWVTEHGSSFLTEYNFNTRQVNRYPTALHPIQISTLPYWLEEDLSGKGGWFNEHRGNRIAFFNFSSRTLTEYEIPTRNIQGGYIANLLTIATDPNNVNKVWFTELTEDKIGYIDRSVPIPFDLRTHNKQIVLEKGQTAQIDIEVTRNPGVRLFNNTLSFNASSSAIISGVPINTMISFSPAQIDLSKMNSTQIVTLKVKDEGMQKGQHILALSATDGAVIRTVYVELMVK